VGNGYEAMRLWDQLHGFRSHHRPWSHNAMNLPGGGARIYGGGKTFLSPPIGYIPLLASLRGHLGVQCISGPWWSARFPVWGWLVIVISDLQSHTLWDSPMPDHINY